MILPRKAIVPLRTTGGLETVGVRCPDHAVTRAIIRAAGVPVAAPSGNTSGRPSPTSAADMLEDMDGKIDGIVDGGPAGGVESTIIDLTVSPPRLLRPGGLPLEDLRRILGEVAVDKAVTQKVTGSEPPRAPGMKYRHYAPPRPGDGGHRPARTQRCIYTGCAAGGGRGVICFEEFRQRFAGRALQSLGAAEDTAQQAHWVFDALRRFDSTDVTHIYAQCPDDTGLGLAVGNRLKKAAGFHIVDADRLPELVIGITGGTGGR